MSDSNISVSGGDNAIVAQDAKFTILDSIEMVQGGQVVARVPATFDLTGVEPKWHEFIMQLVASRRVQAMMPTDEELMQRSAERTQPVSELSLRERFREWRKGIFN